MRSEGYFGWVCIDGKRFEQDVIVHVDGTVTPRPVHLSLPYRDDYFHTPLSEEELGFIAEERPEVVIVGAGYKSMMLLTPRAKELLRGYVSVVRSTAEAMDIMNQEDRKYVAILHLTC